MNSKDGQKGKTFLKKQRLFPTVLNPTSLQSSTNSETDYAVKYLKRYTIIKRRTVVIVVTNCLQNLDLMKLKTKSLNQKLKATGITKCSKL